MWISTLQKPHPFVTLISGYIQQGMLVPELWGYREPAFQTRGVQPRTSNVPAPVLPSTTEEPLWFHWEEEENFGVEYPTKLWLSWTGDMRIALLSRSVALAGLQQAASINICFEVIWRIPKPTWACVNHAGQLHWPAKDLPHKAPGRLCGIQEIKLTGLSVGQALRNDNTPNFSAKSQYLWGAQ